MNILTRVKRSQESTPGRVCCTYSLDIPGLSNLTNDSDDKLMVNNSVFTRYPNKMDDVYLFSWVDYTVFGILLALSSLIGVYFGYKDYRASKQSKTNITSDDGMLNYLVGGRKMKVIPVGCSLVATWVSAIGLFGTTAETYVFGAEYCWLLLPLLALGLFMHFLYLPVFQGLKLTSAHEYLSLRFNKATQIFGSILFTTQVVLWLPIVVYVPSLALHQVTGFDEMMVAGVLVAVCVFYTFLGGIKAVVWTDLFQIMSTVVVYLVIIVKGTSDLGGLSVIYQRNYDSGRLDIVNFSPDPTIRHSMGALLVGGSFFWVATSASQNFVQRYLSLPTLRAARQALWIYVGGLLFFNAASMYLGLLLYAYYSECDPLTTKLAKSKDSLLPLFVVTIFKDFRGVPGLFIAGVFGACLSSLSTGLNSLSAVLLEDYIKVFVKRKLTPLETQLWMRGVVVFFGVTSVLLVLVVQNLGGVLQLSISFASMTLGPLLSLFIVGMMMPWIGAKAAFTGGVSAFIVLAVINFRAQVAVANKELVFQPKPTYTTNCSYTWDNSTLIDKNDISYYYSGSHLSYMYYNFLGVLTCCVVANVATLFFGRNTSKDVNPLLLAPFVRKILNKK